MTKGVLRKLLYEDMMKVIKKQSEKIETKEEILKELEAMVDVKILGTHMKLLKYLYDNHREILRDFEKNVLKSKLRIEFA